MTSRHLRCPWPYGRAFFEACPRARFEPKQPRSPPEDPGPPRPSNSENEGRNDVGRERRLGVDAVPKMVTTHPGSPLSFAVGTSLAEDALSPEVAMMWSCSARSSFPEAGKIGTQDRHRRAEAR